MLVVNDVMLTYPYDVCLINAEPGSAECHNSGMIESVSKFLLNETISNGA